jgi:hypothetical protein
MYSKGVLNCDLVSVGTFIDQVVLNLLLVMGHIKATNRRSIRRIFQLSLVRFNQTLKLTSFQFCFLFFFSAFQFSVELRLLLNHMHFCFFKLYFYSIFNLWFEYFIDYQHPAVQLIYLFLKCPNSLILI